MYSMTGYGKAELHENDIELTVEIKTVNNRTLDFNMKAPRAFLSIEDKIRQVVSAKIKRGRVDLFINFADKRENSLALNIDINKAREYYNAGAKIAENLNIANDITPSYLLKCQDVIAEMPDGDILDLQQQILDTVSGAVDKLNQMRKVEGQKLIADMTARMGIIRELREKISKRAPLVVQDYKEKLKNRIEEALKDVKYDEARLLNEVAIFTDKANIDEELTRLDSHINQFLSIVGTEGAGKKLDFLMQEFNRETNTICSKSNDIEITNLALSLKNEIEKVREQVQNLE